jgi:CMP-2-keto-3-deoxyoctulosonic acid synthetase
LKVFTALLGVNSPKYLEQLRILWNGGRIHVDNTSIHVPAGVDMPEDLSVVKNILEQLQ